MSKYEQQAQGFLDRTGTSIDIVFLRKGKYFPKDKEERDIYDVTLKRGEQEYSFTFGQSLAKTKQDFDYKTGRKSQKRIKPTAYDILVCLEKYETPADVWEFAREFGYTIDSRESLAEVEQTCLAVMNEYNNVMRLFGDVIEELREIQ